MLIGAYCAAVKAIHMRLSRLLQQAVYSAKYVLLMDQLEVVQIVVAMVVVCGMAAELWALALSNQSTLLRENLANRNPEPPDNAHSMTSLMKWRTCHNTYAEPNCIV